MSLLRCSGFFALLLLLLLCLCVTLTVSVATATTTQMEAATELDPLSATRSKGLMRAKVGQMLTKRETEMPNVIRRQPAVAKQVVGDEQTNSAPQPRLNPSLPLSPLFDEFRNQMTFRNKIDHPTVVPPQFDAALFQSKYCRGVDKVMVPTVENPFFFFHLPKTGGMSLRDFLYRDVFLPRLFPDMLTRNERSPTNGILTPCYNMHCVHNLTEAVNITSCSSIFLGHFFPFEIISELHRVQLQLLPFTEKIYSPPTMSPTMSPTATPTAQVTTNTNSGSNHEAGKSEDTGEKKFNGIFPPSGTFHLDACPRWQDLSPAPLRIADAATTTITTSSTTSSTSSTSTTNSKRGPASAPTRHVLQDRVLNSNDRIFWDSLRKSYCCVILRNPYQRAVSGYYEFGYPLTNLTLSKYLATHSTEEFLYISSSYVNAQTAILGGEPNPENVNHLTLQVAKRVLSHCVVGIQEDMTAFVTMLSAALSTSGAKLNSINSFKKKNIPSHVLEDRRALNKTDFKLRMAPYLALDDELWRFARDRLIPIQRDILMANELANFQQLMTAQTRNSSSSVTTRTNYNRAKPTVTDTATISASYNATSI
jgi:hypothetical protein